jgi:Arf-GAP/SH3 domain/ANK repeat/PH domain-containing protein
MFRTLKIYVSKDASSAFKCNSFFEFQKCRALYDCEADNSDEISFRQGDIIWILNERTEDDNWMEGLVLDENGGTRRGMFPISFVELNIQWGRCRVSRHSYYLYPVQKEGTIVPVFIKSYYLFIRWGLYTSTYENSTRIQHLSKDYDTICQFAYYHSNTIASRVESTQDSRILLLIVTFEFRVFWEGITWPWHDLPEEWILYYNDFVVSIISQLDISLRNSAHL